MPYCAMLDIIKHLQIAERCQDEEWRKKYIALKVAESHENGTLPEQHEMDIDGLRAFTNSL